MGSGAAVYIAGVACRLVARLPDASRKAEEYAALGMFQEAAETAATVSFHCSMSCHFCHRCFPRDTTATDLDFLSILTQGFTHAKPHAFV